MNRPMPDDAAGEMSLEEGTCSPTRIGKLSTFGSPPLSIQRIFSTEILLVTGIKTTKPRFYNES